MIYYTVVLKNYCIDENSTVVCYSISLFVFHLKVIAAGCNANVIVSCIFSVCHRQLILTDMYKPVNKKYIPQIGAKIYNLRHQVLNIYPSSARAWALGWSD